MKYQTILATANFNRPAIDILIELILASNDYLLSKNHATPGLAQKLDQRPDVMVDADTFIPVEIEPAYDDRFPGNNGFMYQRLPLTALQEVTTVTVVPGSIPYTTHSLIPQINARFNVQFTEADLVNDTFYTTSRAVTLRAAEGSWAWVGERAMEVEEANGEMPVNGRVTADNILRVTEDGRPRIISV